MHSRARARILQKRDLAAGLGVMLALVSLQCRCALPPYLADLKLSINSVNRYKLQMGASLVVDVIQGHS